MIKFHEKISNYLTDQDELPPLTIVLLCSPSAGSISSWVPVIFFLAKHFKISLHVVFGKTSTPAQWSLISTEQKVVDYFSISYTWRERNRNWNHFNKMRFSETSSESFLRKYQSLPRKWYHTLSGKSSLKDLVKKKPDIIFYDIYEETKGYLKDFFYATRGIRKVSLSHGLNPYSASFVPAGLDANEKARIDPERVIILKYTDSFDWTDRFLTNIPKYVIGWPTLSNNWLRVSEALSPHPIAKHFLLFCSRGCNDKFFTYQEKAHVLRETFEFCRRQNLLFVIKNHPKEIRNGQSLDHAFIADILGAESEGLHWTVCNDNLISLAKNATIVISAVSTSVILQTIAVNSKVFHISREEACSSLVFALKFPDLPVAVRHVSFKNLSAESLCELSKELPSDDKRKQSVTPDRDESIDKAILIIKNFLKE